MDRWKGQVKEMRRSLLRAIRIALVVFVIAGVAAMALPVQLNVTGRSQYPSLPNGCESVAASVALEALGTPVTAEVFASQYLPKAAVGSGISPENAYIGDPFGDGYYCYPQALAAGINSFLAGQPTTRQAKTHPLTTVSEIALRLHLQKKPLIVWTTVDDKLAARDEASVWQIDGGEYHPYKNLHAVVVDGVSGFRVHLVDSVNGERWMSVFKFIPIYYSMGMRTVYFTD